MAFFFTGFCTDTTTAPKPFTFEILTIDSGVLKNSPKVMLKNGQQKRIKHKPFRLDIGYGETNCFLFEVPSFKKDSVFLNIKSLVVKNKVYYPIFFTLNKDFQVIRMEKNAIEFEGSLLFGLYIRDHILVDKNTKYLLMVSDSSMISKNVDHQFDAQNSKAIYTGNSVIFTPGNPGRSVKMTISDLPKVILEVPYFRRKKPFTREHGVYFGFGVCFGGEKVASNPDGDDYRVGGGAVFQLGYAQSLFSSPLVYRIGTGIRYQGSKNGVGRNLACPSEFVITYQTRYLNFGFGGQLETNNSTRDFNGKIFQFKPALGPKFLIEGKDRGVVNLSIEYILTNFKTTNNVLYSGNRIGFAFKFFFGR
ncbi:MAG: hypothetical protein V4561_14415 [Bacteroidota bacterium]